jgi:HEAT repeat protein
VDRILGELKKEDGIGEWEAVEKLARLGPDAVDSLIAGLEADDLRTIEVCALALGFIGDRRAAEPLVDALARVYRIYDTMVCTTFQSADHSVREAIFAVGGPPMESMLERTRSADEEERLNGIFLLGKEGSGEAVDVLLGLYDGEDSWRVRWEIVLALAKAGDRRALPLLVKALKDSNDTVSHYAAEAIGDLGGEGQVDALIESLRGGNEGAGEALGRIGGRKAARALVDALDSFAVKERYVLFRALGRAGDDGVLPYLGASWKAMQADEGSYEKWWAAFALCKLAEDGPAFRFLLNHLRGRGFHEVPEILGELEDSRALPALLVAMQSEPDVIPNPAAEAVMKILEARQDETALDGLAAMTRHENHGVAANALAALGASRRESDVDVLAGALDHADDTARWAAVRGLSDVASKKAVAALVRALGDGSPQVRSRSVVALRKITKQRFTLDYEKWRRWAAGE